MSVCSVVSTGKNNRFTQMIDCNRTVNASYVKSGSGHFILGFIHSFQMPEGDDKFFLTNSPFR